LRERCSISKAERRGASETPDPYDQRLVTEFTSQLRSSGEPRWQRLRERLQQEGIPPEGAAIGTLFPDDPSMEFGIVASRDGRTFSFDFDFLRDPDGNPVAGRLDAWVVNFEPLDKEQREFTYTRAIEAGNWFLNGEGSGLGEHSGDKPS
jgi:hypothetical protein